MIVPLAVEILGIAHVEGVESSGQGALGLGDTNNVDVVGHQAVSPDIHGESLRIFTEPIEIAAVVGFGLEDRTVLIPPLHEVVGVSGEGNAG
jgi:hypothetical protein